MTGEHILDGVRDYLAEAFEQVDLAEDADGASGSRFLYVRDGKSRRVVEVTDTFLKGEADLVHPLAAVREWDLAGVVRKANAGTVVRVTTRGLLTA
jgi:hypothetical protein